MQSEISLGKVIQIFKAGYSGRLVFDNFMTVEYNFTAVSGTYQIQEFESG